MNDSSGVIDKSVRSVFVGNIPYEATEEKLKDIFGEVGPVVSFKLVFDRETGKPKGKFLLQQQYVNSSESVGQVATSALQSFSPQFSHQQHWLSAANTITTPTFTSISGSGSRLDPDSNESVDSDPGRPKCFC
jgi:hypothetical protein